MNAIYIISALLFLFCFAPEVRAGEPLPPLSAYAGAKTCGKCHPDHYKAWKETPHKNAVRNARAEPSAVTAHFEGKIEGFGKEDIEYVIGGHWYERYMVKMGDDFFVLPRIWSVASHKWDVTDAWSWKKKPYSTQCKGCHATRYDPEAKVQVEHEVGCEACHGPGARHAKTKGRVPVLDLANIDPDERDMVCASCHVRGKDVTGKYPFAVGYVPGRNLEDYYQPLAVMDGETPRQTFLNTFRKWFAKQGGGQPPACDVCGIDRPANDAQLTETQKCRKCHNFQDVDHTNSGHPGDIELECLDCHRMKTRVLAAVGDVHSPDHFKVHKFTMYDRGSDAACLSCHGKRQESSFTQ